MSILILYFPCAAIHSWGGYYVLCCRIKNPLRVFAEGIFYLGGRFFTFEPVFPFLIFPQYQYGGGNEDG